MDTPVSPVAALSARKVSFCLAASHRQAEDIMHRLELEHFSDGQISVIFPDQGAHALPGLGSFIGAGPLISSLSAAPDARAKGLAAGLIGLGMPEARAYGYQRQLESGSFLLAVHAPTDEEIDHAVRIFAELGATEIHRCGHHHSVAA